MRWVVPNVLTREECRDTIDAAEATGFEAMGPRYPDGYRNNDRALLDDASLAAKLFARLRPHLAAEYEGWQLAGLNTRFRFCRYREGQQFTRHRDGAWAPSVNERSWLTVMLYLNDAGEFTGGATRFDDGSVPPREGQAIIFDHREWHDGEAVTAGVKYVMRTDVMYRRSSAARVKSAPPSGLLQRDGVIAQHEGYVWVVRAMSDGSIASGARDCTVRRDGRVVRTTDGSVTALLDVDGALWSGGRHGRIEDGTRSWLAHDGAVLNLEREATDTVRSCGADGRVLRWSTRGEPLGEVSRHAGWVWGVGAVEPVTAIAKGGEGHRDGTLQLGRTWQAHAGAVTALIHLDDDRWVSAGEDCAVRLWTVEGALLGEGFHADFVRTLARVDRDHFVSGAYDGAVVRWKVRNRQSPASDR